MRLFVFFLFLLLIAVTNGFLDQYENEYDSLDVINNFYDNKIPDVDSESRSFARAPGDLPKTAAEMMARFNTNFLNFLASRKQADWNKLMQVVSPDAYIETCMESAFGLSIDQFHKWMTYLSKYYVEVGLTSTVVKDSSDDDVTTELIYRTEVRSGDKGSDKWLMSATFDKQKGHFMINSLHMLSDCKNIPKTPPLEPAIPVETFISSLKTKLVNDIFLDGGLRYKSAYESMNNYLNSHLFISVCDVGRMTRTQFVEYWYKRYGKVKKYMDHTFEVIEMEGIWYIYFAVTFEGSPRSLFRDRYRFRVQKHVNLFVEYFENFMDWTVFEVQQNCTENKTKMTKSDESLLKMSLASRRWDQVFASEFNWDTKQAFMELFDRGTFNGYACGGIKFESWEKFENWLSDHASYYKKSIPKETHVYEYKDSKIGFWIINEMTAKDNSTSTHRVFFEGYYKDVNWQLNHLGFSCNE